MNRITEHITHQRRPGGDAVFSCDHNDSGLRATPAGFRPSDAQALIPFSERVNPIAPSVTLGGGNPQSGSSNLSVPRGFSRVPISKNAVRLLKSLSCNPSSRSGGLDLNGSYRPGWTREDLATTTVVPPRGSAFAGLSPPAAVSTPDRRVSWGPLPFGNASKSNSGTFRCSASQLGEGCCAQYSTGGLSPVPAGPPTIGSSERMVTRWGPPRTREEAQGWDGISDPPDPFGQPRPCAPQWHPDQPWTQLPIAGAESNSGTSQAIHSNSDPSSSWTPSATDTNTPASGWFCLPSSSGGHPESPFCRPSNDPSLSSNGDGGRADTQEGRRGGHVSSRGMSQLLGGCTQGAPGSLAVALARPIQGGLPAAAPLGHPTGECHSSRDLQSQLPVYREALQQFVIDTPRPLTEAADFRWRATAYRNSYFKSYRRATLLGFSPELREDFLFSLWNDVQNPIGPPPSKYKNLQWIVKQDLLEFNLLSGQTEY